MFRISLWTMAAIGISVCACEIGEVGINDNDGQHQSESDDNDSDAGTSNTSEGDQEDQTQVPNENDGDNDGATNEEDSTELGRSIRFLYSISGQQTVSGQHNDVKNGTDETTYTERVFEITGKYPGLWSGDFLFGNAIYSRWERIDEAQRQWSNGALVHLMWHVCPPTESELCGWDNGILSYLDDAQWNDLITDGGYLNRAWKARIDEIAQYLQHLEDAGVEVLWRPLHEMNQGAFWWGGRPGPDGTRRLYEITYDYMVFQLGLSNLVWVWNLQDLSMDFEEYRPRNFDVASLDFYAWDGYTQDKYQALLTVAGNKPIAIGECARLPTPAELEEQPAWTFFMNWSYLLEQSNTDQEIIDLYAYQKVITLDEMQLR